MFCHFFGKARNLGAVDIHWMEATSWWL